MFGNGQFEVLLLLAIMGAIYFLPTIIAHRRSHEKAGPIAAINIFLGWTFMAWLACLIWSLTGPNNRTATVAAEWFCARCGRRNRIQDPACINCGGPMTAI